MYQIALCDDDVNFIQQFLPRIKKELLANDPDGIIDTFTSISQLESRMASGTQYDLILLDILIGGDNGYDFAKRLRNKGIQTDIIFITSTTDYAVSGYEVSPLLYLIKPVSDERLSYAFSVFLKKHTPTRIVLKLNQEYQSLNITDILYVEVSGHTTIIHTTTDQIKLRMPLSTLEQQLPSHCFSRSHQSFLVNLIHIEGISRYRITLTNGQTLPISQSRYSNLQKDFLNYAANKNIRI